MLTTTLPFDEFFAVPSSPEGHKPEPWLQRIAELLAPLPVARIILANSHREVLCCWEDQDRGPLQAYDLTSLPKSVLNSSPQELHYLQPDEGSLVIVRMHENANSAMESRLSLLQLMWDQGQSWDQDSVAAHSDTIMAATDLAARSCTQEQAISVLKARNEQLLRQQETLRKEHEQILESAVRERDERIAEQRQYMDRLEREVALRTLELNERATQLRRINDRMKRNLESAARIQTALLPATLPARRSVEFAWKFQPCDELAGDSLNVFNLDEDHIGLYVLDVSGHGVPSALLSVTLSRFLMPGPGQTSLLKTSHDQPPYYQITSPCDVAKQLNQLFPMNESTEQYFTILYAVLNLQTRELRYVSAGHPGLVYQPHDGPVQLRETESFAIGWFEDAEYEEQVISLKPGDRVFLYSDGITESADVQGSAFGNQRLLDFVDRSRQHTLQESVSGLLTEVVKWTGQRSPQDDLSILALELSL